MRIDIALGVYVIFCMFMILLSGCAHNPCIDNPRNMQCMTAEELEEAL